MFLDILIPVLAAIAQIMTGFLGWRVTVDGVKKDRKALYEGLFASASLAGVVCVGLSAYRGNATVKELQGLRDRLAHTHIRMDITALTIAVEDPHKLQKEWRPFMPGYSVMFNVNYRNVGLSNSLRTGVVGSVIITGVRPDVDSEFSKQEKKFEEGWTGDELVPQGVKFFTAMSGKLSEEESRKIVNGEIGIYVIAIARFSDATGEYKQEFCKWLQPHSSTVWHGCGVHELETKLK